MRNCVHERTLAKKYMNCHKCLRLLSVAPFLILSGGAIADWQVEPFAKSSLFVDDNSKFTADNRIESSGIVVEAGAGLINETDAIKTRVQPRVAYRAYSEDSNLNSFDQYLDLSTSSEGERSDLGLGLKFANDSTLTSELEDSGLVSQNKRRLLFSMQPSWRYRLSPLNSVSLRYGFSGIQYEDSGTSGLNDYDNQTASLSFERRLSEQSDFVVRSAYQRYNVIELTNKADTASFELGYLRRLSDTLKTSIFAGGFSTDSTVAGVSEQTTGVSASASLDYKQERTSYRAKFRAGVVPSSVGEVYKENRLTLGINSKATQKLSWGLAGVIVDRSTISDISSQVDRTYFSISPRISWTISRDWALNAVYTADGQTSSDEKDVARNQIFVGVEYRKLAPTSN